MLSSAETTEVLKKFNSQPPLAVLVLCGDSVRFERLAQALINQILNVKAAGAGKTAPGLNLRAAEIDAASLARIFEDVATLGLFQSHKIIQITELDGIKTEYQKELMALINANPPGVTFILSAQNLPKANPFYKHALKAQTLIDLGNLGVKSKDRNEEKKRQKILSEWIRAELGQEGLVKYSNDLIQALRDFCEDHPDRLVKVITHFALYCEGGLVKAEDFSRLFPEAPSISEFKLIDALETRRWASAEVLMEQVLAAGKSPFALLGLINSTYLQQARIVALLESGATAGSLRDHLKLNPYVFEKRINAVRGVNGPRVKTYLKALLMADSKLKNRSLGENAVLSELFEKLCR